MLLRREEAIVFKPLINEEGYEMANVLLNMKLAEYAGKLSDTQAQFEKSPTHILQDDGMVLKAKISELEYQLKTEEQADATEQANSGLTSPQNGSPQGRKNHCL